MQSSSNRIVFFDLLRGWAGLVMIEVHVVNAFLLPEFRTAAWFPSLNFLNGLVAPAFLFVAGLVFTVVSERKMEEFRNLGSSFWRQLGRIFLIWGIGYALHIPTFSFSRTIHETTEAGWLAFYQVDVLHCIAVGLLVLFAARLLFRQRRSYGIFLWSTGISVLLLTPVVWGIDFQWILHPAVAAYFNSQHSSLFPLFPWMAFILFGGVVGIHYLDSSEGGDERRFIRTITLWGSGLILLYAFARIPWDSLDIRANPLFFGLRFGIVLFLLVFFWWYARKRRTRETFVLDISRETLLVYAAHLLVIYGTFWNEQSLAMLFGGGLSPWECLAATVVLSLVMVGAAKAWHALKTSSRRTARGAALAFGLLVTIIFFIK